jgi:hypothetical protein
MSAEDVAVVRGAYEAVGRGEIEAFIAALHPQVTWIEPEGAPGGFGARVLHNADEVVSEVFV